MHISTPIIALLSITTLAASLPSSSIDNSTTTDSSPLDRRRVLGGQITSWAAPDCTAKTNSEWDGKVTKLYPGCVKFAPKNEYISVSLNFGVLQVYRDENCKELVRRILAPKPGNLCEKKGDAGWGSVKLFMKGRHSLST